jgi:hypothetical protein
MQFSISSQALATTKFSVHVRVGATGQAEYESTSVHNPGLVLRVGAAVHLVVIDSKRTGVFRVDGATFRTDWSLWPPGSVHEVRQRSMKSALELQKCQGVFTHLMALTRLMPDGPSPPCRLERGCRLADPRSLTIVTPQTELFAFGLVMGTTAMGDSDRVVRRAAIMYKSQLGCTRVVLSAFAPEVDEAKVPALQSMTSLGRDPVVRGIVRRQLLTLFTDVYLDVPPHSHGVLASTLTRAARPTIGFHENGSENVFNSMRSSIVRLHLYNVASAETLVKEWLLAIKEVDNSVLERLKLVQCLVYASQPLCSDFMCAVELMSSWFSHATVREMPDADAYACQVRLARIKPHRHS